MAILDGRAATNQVLSGGSGDDQFLHNPGFSGHDVINDTGGNDSVVFDLANLPFVLPAGWDLYRDGNNLVFDFYALGSLTITGQFATSSPVIEMLHEASDVILGPLTFQNALAGTAGNDVIVGSDGGDAISGGNGNDMIGGGAGNDTILGGSGSDILLGGGGNDLVDGGADNDNIQGGEGQDTLIGGAGNDYIDGGVYADRLNDSDANYASYASSTSAVNVDLSGITGDGSAGFGTAVDGLGGVDALINISRVIGSNHNDTITGSSALVLEVFEGGAGNDTINGGAITDTRNGDNTNRVTYQNALGAVTVSLGTGLATGAAGNDTLININAVWGSEYGDVLNGSDRTDVTELFQGRGGNDTIDGAGGYDLVNYDHATAAVTVSLTSGTASGDASVGTDTLLNIEAIKGSMYDDTLTGSNNASMTESFEGFGGNDVINGMGGTDRVDYYASIAGVIVNLATGTASDGFGGTDVLSNIENVRGSRYFNDSLTGNASDNHLAGQGGNDTIYGGGGNDTLDGGPGADWLDGESGMDLVSYASAGSAITAYLSTGLGAGSGGDADGDLYVSIEGVIGSDYADVLVGAAGAANILIGGAGDDTIYGEQLDTIFGGEGTDTFFGTQGGALNFDLGAAGIEIAWGGSFADRLDATSTTSGVIISGQGGADTMLGGSGDDVFYGDNTDSVNGGAGNDVFFGGQGGALNLNLATAELETVWGSVVGDMLDGSTATQALSLIGQGGADTMIGGSGDDFLYFDHLDFVQGGGGFDWAVATLSSTGVNLNVAATGFENAWGSPHDDTLTAAGSAGTVVLVGDTGNDTLIGGDATDYLYGFGGNDVLIGGPGTDVLVGDGGNDLFTYMSRTGSGFDSVFYFVSGEDKFAMTAGEYGMTAGGSLSAGSSFIAGASPTATSAIPTFLYNTTTGILTFDLDGTGGTYTSVSIAQLFAAPALAASDFVFV